MPQELVIVLSDQIDCRWFSVLLESLLHNLSRFLNIQGCFWVVKDFATLLTNEFLEEVGDVLLIFDRGVCLSVNLEPPVKIGIVKMGSSNLLRWQILHLLLQGIVFSLKNNGVLWQDAVVSCESWESCLIFELFRFFQTCSSTQTPST